jgi:serine/threonine protein kinase
LGDSLEPKISDFGMTRELHDNQTHNTTLTGLGPIRWMSPEAIQNRIYSNFFIRKKILICILGFKSDAWSFGENVYLFYLTQLGALITEIVTKNIPFPDLQNMDVVFEVTKRGRHPEIPFHAPEPVRLVMEVFF